MPVKRVIQFGYQGNFKVNGKTYPGSLYFSRTGTTGGFGMVWYYGTSGNMAGNAVLSPQADGSYVGTFLFLDRKGATIDSGTATVR